MNPRRSHVPTGIDERVELVDGLQLVVEQYDCHFNEPVSPIQTGGFDIEYCEANHVRLGSAWASARRC